MKKSKLLICIILMISFSSWTCSDDADSESDEGLIASDAQLVNLGSGYSFTEGPAVDKDGNVFFTDQPLDVIYKWNASTSDITPFLEGTGRSNGMAFDKDGNLISCADMHGEIWKIAPNGSHEVLVNNYNNKLGGRSS
jgi:gluconolactonase